MHLPLLVQSMGFESLSVNVILVLEKQTFLCSTSSLSLFVNRCCLKGFNKVVLHTQYSALYLLLSKTLQYVILLCDLILESLLWHSIQFTHMPYFWMRMTVKPVPVDCAQEMGFGMEWNGIQLYCQMVCPGFGGASQSQSTQPINPFCLHCGKKLEKTHAILEGPRQNLNPRAVIQAW